MALFMLNTGARDAAACSLRWEWEVRSPKLRYSIFVVPKDAVIESNGKVTPRKKGQTFRSNPLFDWRARQDLNPRPPGS